MLSLILALLMSVGQSNFSPETGVKSLQFTHHVFPNPQLKVELRRARTVHLRDPKHKERLLYTSQQVECGEEACTLAYDVDLYLDVDGQVTHLGTLPHIQRLIHSVIPQKNEGKVVFEVLLIRTVEGLDDNKFYLIFYDINEFRMLPITPTMIRIFLRQQ